MWLFMEVQVKTWEGDHCHPARPDSSFIPEGHQGIDLSRPEGG